MRFIIGIALGFAAGVIYREHNTVDYPKLEKNAKTFVASLPDHFDKLLDFVKNRNANGPNVQELSPRDPVDAIPSTTRNSDVMK